MNEVARAPGTGGLSSAEVVIRLSDASIGDAGTIVDVRAECRAGGGHGVSVDELQRRLLEFGFVEGAHVEVMHEGAINHDPIAVRLDDMRVALRRRDAEDVFVLLDQTRGIGVPKA
jgi:ferrous iron transport protein A